METVRIRNWEKWQTYRKDRGNPPWIKVHRSLMRDPEWVSLTDAQRGQLVAIWLLAADRNGAIPASGAVLRKLCHLDREPDLKLFANHGFLEDDANLAPKRRQHDRLEAETETETEAEGVLLFKRQKSNTLVDATKIKTLLELWNSQAHPNLPRVTVMNKTRENHVKSRLKSIPEESTWVQIIEKINNSKFLTGRTYANGRKPFLCTFDWMLLPSNLTKIMEGNYDDKK